MAKLTLTDLTSLSSNETSAVNNINANSALIEAALENTLSLDGTTPNAMTTDLDMNSHSLLNVTGLSLPGGQDIADLVDYAEEWANKAEDSLVSSSAGGDQVDDYSALHHAAKAAADAVSTDADATTATQQAAIAVAAAASVAWSVTAVTSGPISAAAGFMYICDTSGGNIVINLPSIGTVGEPASIAVRKESGDTNTVTVNYDGTDTINNAASAYVIDNTSSHSFYADEDTTPYDNWEAFSMGGEMSNPIVDNFKNNDDFDDGVTNFLPLSGTVNTENALIVLFDGAVQHHNTYYVSNNKVYFHVEDTPGTPLAIPAPTDDVEIQYFETVEIGVPADNSVTAAKLSGAMYDAATIDNAGVFDMSASNDFLWTPTGTDELDFTNRTSGQRGLILLDNDPGANTITFGADFYGPSTAGADLSTAGTYLISYWCTDGTDIHISYSAAQEAI